MGASGGWGGRVKLALDRVFRRGRASKPANPTNKHLFKLFAAASDMVFNTSNVSVDSN